ncbi:MAG: choloylglycine hydrolase [Butyrivibrio sp.]
MCTAITYKTRDHYFGRNMDYEHSYNEQVVITPRNYPFNFRRAGSLKEHYAIIGVATVVDDYPLYFDGTNEKGLSMAGLNFPDNAVYYQDTDGKDNVAPFEFIPWILGQCEDIARVRELLGRINLVNVNFSDKLPLAPLHWMISDRNESIVVECVQDGMKIYDNPVEVLTNNPEFNMQLFNLNNYMQLSTQPPVNSFAQKLQLNVYSRGMGAMGLPGDLSSQSRFVKAAFTRMNSLSGESEEESISQFFHILGSVAQQRGCVQIGDLYEITLYASCCNTDKGIYYYTTYENSSISAVDMHRENLESENLIVYEMIKSQKITMQN